MGSVHLMDAITMLKDDHKTVEKLFKRFEDAGDRAYVEKREIVDRIIEELSVHAAIEEMLFYPVARATVADTEDIALESLEEHGVAKWLLSELDSLDPQAERFDAKVTVLIENVRHHVEEEEQDFFPKVRDELGRKDLQELGDAMAEAKKTAPTHPHPRSPDAPPANAGGGHGGRRGRPHRRHRLRRGPGQRLGRAGRRRGDPAPAPPAAVPPGLEGEPHHRPSPALERRLGRRGRDRLDRVGPRDR